jgi:hypothetical protein
MPADPKACTARCQHVGLTNGCLLGSTNAEDHALLLTSIRRAVKAAADYHFPAQDVPVACADGKSRVLDDAKYLNRLHEFCQREFRSGSSDELVRAEFDYLSVFLHRLNDVASKGVHAQVTALEARQGLFGVYLFLSNLIAKLTAPQPNTTPSLGRDD